VEAFDDNVDHFPFNQIRILVSVAFDGGLAHARPSKQRMDQPAPRRGNAGSSRS